MKSWLKNAVLYQIYPTSFYDSDGDGVGDLNGITKKMPYISSLGVDAIWLNPCFKSPFKDGGYDVSDYKAIDPRFGTMTDMENLIAATKKAGIKIFLDLVIGHTSWEHEWFKNSAKKEKNEYWDYYIWTDSIFNTYKNKTISGLYDRDGCYYVNYYGCQPALNYGFNDLKPDGENEDGYSTGESWKMHYTDKRLEPLRNEIINIIKFWLAKGVDGFRVDMANSLVKGCVYNSPDDKDIEGLKWVWDKIFREVKSEYPESIFISEWCCPENAVAKCGFDVDFFAHDNPVWNDLFRNEKGTNIISIFEKGDNYFSANGKGSVVNFLEETRKLNENLKGKGVYSAITGSHDEVRLATGKNIDELKTVFAFLLTYKHMPFIYYGDEIGIEHNFKVNRDGGFIRTGSRTPMQWDETKNRGFSTADELYLPTDLKKGCSVAAQEKDENSLLCTVKKLIAIKKKYSCLNMDGDFEIVECVNGGYPLIYNRKDDTCCITVIINPSSSRVERKLEYSEVLLSSNCVFEGSDVKICGTGFAVLKK